VEIEHVLARLDDPHAAGRDAALARMGELFGKTDAYDLIPHENEGLPPQYDIHMRVWSDAEAYRRSGEMLALGRNIRCPVVAIHGDYDPHPAEGIQKPLAGVLRDFRFVLLPHCGHEPWLERQAREPFYRVLREALRDAGA
jgi:pimeloyl-ACP methyl ester carboxylesterase